MKMSSTPQAVIDANVAKAVAILRERLAPAKLNFTAKTQRTLGGYLDDAREAGGVDYTSDPRDLADVMESGIKAHLLEESVDWDVSPKRLTATKKMNKVERVKTASEQSAEFADKFKAGEKVAAYKKAEAQAEQQIGIEIGNYFPVNNRGDLLRGKQQEEQAKMRESVANAKKRGVSMQQVLPVIRKHIADLYEADEKSRERGR
jgi:hypothetical protein